MNNHDAMMFAIYLGSGLFVGIIFHRWVMPLLAKLAEKTSLKSDDLIVSVIRKWIVAWFLALGVFIGLRRIDMSEHYHKMLENGLMIFYIFSLTLIVAKVVSGMIRINASGSDTAIPSSSIIGNIVRIIIYCLGLLIILQSMGISVTPILTALGVGGLAVALALQDTLSNLFAGLQIIASGKINTGDFVKLSSGEDGYIHDINWRSTSIRAVSDHIIIVPNNKLSTMIVFNYSLLNKEMSFGVELGVSYDSDLEKVERVMIEVIRETLNNTEGGVKDFEPVIRFYGFGDSSIQVRAILRVEEFAKQFPVRHAFIKNIHKRFKEEGINIPFPIRTVYMKNEKDSLPDFNQ